MTTSRLFLTGIRASGRHGANPGEKEEPQEFVVDLDVEVKTFADVVEETVDYRTLARVAREVVEERSFDLLETLASAVATAAAEIEGVVQATAVVHKPNAARSLQIDGVAAAATVEGEAKG